MLTRRNLSALFLAAAAPQSQAAPPPPCDTESVMARQLRLTPSELRDLAPGGERALQDAQILADLPLDDVAPGFVVLPVHT